MADDCDEGEWFDYSSSSVGLEESSFEPLHKQQEDESTGENVQHNTSEVENLEKYRELLNSSLCQTCSQPSFICKPEQVSLIKGPCNHWLWAKLVSKLNSIRQPKWDGSCLERSYHRCLQISINTIPDDESTEVSLDYYDKNIFNFHALNTSLNQLDSGCLSPGSTEQKHLNSSTEKAIEKNNGNRKNSSLSDTSFEDAAPELEWSDNDVRDPTLETDSSSTPGFDESEAFSELARLSYDEIVSLRDDLRDYTKQYSDVLVVELENRDAYIREKELKNDFISSFLAVQAKIREATRAASNKKKFSLQSNSSSNTQSLTTTIPYEIQNGGPTSEILEKLIEIMEAMRTDSSNVPTLLTNYILKVLCK